MSVIQMMYIEDKNSLGRYRASGLLKFRIDEMFKEREWIDTSILLEEKLSSILAKLELTSKQMKEEEINRKKWHEEYQRQQLEEKLAKERHENELKAFKQLYFDAMRWQQSQFISNYLNHIEESIKDSPEPNLDLIEKISWGRKKVDWFNPLVDLEDEILGNPTEEIKGIIETSF